MKTHEELQLSKEEFDALLKVREMLATTPTEYREVARVGGEFDSRGLEVLDGFGGFDMSRTCVSPADTEMRGYECGTVGCIGGWMGVHMYAEAPKLGEQCVVGPVIARRIDEYVRHFETGGCRWDEPISDLFYPSHYLMPHIRAHHAVQAIDHFLEHGEIDKDIWRGIVFPEGETREEGSV